jgi:hypothetical protein
MRWNCFRRGRAMRSQHIKHAIAKIVAARDGGDKRGDKRNQRERTMLARALRTGGSANTSIE